MKGEAAASLFNENKGSLTGMDTRMIRTIFMALMLTVAVAAPSFAATPDQAQAFIDKVGQQAMNTIKARQDGKLNDAAAKGEFRKILGQSFDIPTIARFTLGRYWNVATPEQQKEFTALVQDIIINKYADRVLNASTGTYEMGKASAINERDFAVLMTIKPDHDAPINFAWRVRNINGKLKVIDLAVEGISMSVTNRSDFASVIERNGGNVQALIDALKAKK